MTIFNVGDRVQILDSPYGPLSIPDGTKGTVTEVRQGGALLLVKFDGKRLPYAGAPGWACFPEELTYAEEGAFSDPLSAYEKEDLP